MDRFDSTSTTLEEYTQEMGIIIDGIPGSVIHDGEILSLENPFSVTLYTESPTCSALHAAAKRGFVADITFLLDQGFPVDSIEDT